MTTKAVAVFASVLLSGLAFLPNAAGAAQPAQNSFPAIGNDTNGPEFLLTLGPNGNNSLVLFPGSTDQGPYDGIEDTYIGVWNNSGKSVANVFLSATSTQIFGFDGDGIGSNDSTGYGGPGVSFSNINAAQTSGTVNFAGGLAPDGTAYFALEEALSFNASTGAVTGLAVGRHRHRDRYPVLACCPIWA